MVNKFLFLVDHTDITNNDDEDDGGVTNKSSDNIEADSTERGDEDGVDVDIIDEVEGDAFRQVVDVLNDCSWNQQCDSM